MRESSGRPRGAPAPRPGHRARGNDRQAMLYMWSTSTRKTCWSAPASRGATAEHTSAPARTAPGRGPVRATGSRRQRERAGLGTGGQRPGSPRAAEGRRV